MANEYSVEIHDYISNKVAQATAELKKAEAARQLVTDGEAFASVAQNNYSDLGYVDSADLRKELQVAVDAILDHVDSASAVR